MLRITNIISLIFTFFLLIYSFNSNQVFVISFIIMSQFVLFKTFKMIYRNFLVSKTKKTELMKSKIHYLEDLYRPFNNYIIKNKTVYDENEFSIYLLSKNNKKS